MELHLSMDTGPVQRLWPYLQHAVVEGLLTVNEACDVAIEEIVSACTVEESRG